MADGSLIFDTKVDTDGVSSGVKKIGSIAKGAIVGTSAIITGMTASVAGLGAKALSSSIEFESAFAGVRKTVDATEQQFTELRNGILDMSKRMPSSAKEIAEVAEAAGQLGIQTPNVLGFTETMIKLGESTNMTAEQSATQFARFANIVGMSQKDFDRLGSVIVDLGNNMATTESEIVEMGLRLAGTGRQVGLTESQIMALSAAMSSVGVNAEAGGSSMSRVLAKINTQVLSGGKNLQDFASIAGMSADEFSNKWKTAPAEAINTFVTGLDKIKKSGGDVNATLKDLGITSVVEIDTLSRLAGAHDVLNQALNIGQEAWDKNSALQNEYQQRLETTKAQIDILKNKVTGLSIAIGDDLKVAFGQSIEMANGWVDRLNDAFKLGGLDGFANELSYVITDAITYIAGQIPNLVNVASQMATSLANGIKQNAPQLATSAVSIIQSLVSGLAQNIPTFLDAGLTLIENLASGLGNGMPNLMTTLLNGIIQLGQVIINHIPALITAGAQLLQGLAQGIADNLPLIIEKGPELINNFAEGLAGQIPTIITAGLNIIMTLAEGLINAIPTLIANIPAIILAIVNAFMLFEWASIGKSLLSFIGQGMKSMLDAIVTLAKSIGEGILNAIKTYFHQGVSTGHQFISMLAQGFRSAVGLVKSGIQAVIQAVLSFLRSAVSKMFSIGGDMVRGIARGIINAGATVVHAVMGVVDGAINFVKSKLGINSPSRVMAKVIGQHLPSGIALGVEKNGNSLINAFDGLLTKVNGVVPKRFAKMAKGIGNKLNKSMADGVGDNNSLLSLINQNGEAIIKSMRTNLEKAHVIEEQKLKEHDEKMKALRLSNIDKAYTAYGKLIQEAINREEAKVKALKAQIEQAKTIKHNKAVTDRLRTEQKSYEESIKSLKKYADDFKKHYDDIVKEYKSAVDSLLKDQEKLENKLSTYGEILKEVKDSEGKTQYYNDGIVKMQLADGQKKLDQLREFGRMLDELRQKGADAELLKGIVEMPVEKALSAGRTFLAQSQEDFNNFLALQKAQREEAKRIAKEYYDEELDLLNKNYTTKLQKNLGEIVGQSGVIGKNSANALADGFKKNASKFKNAVASVVSEAIAQAQQAMEAITGGGALAGALAGAGGTTYNHTVKIENINTSETKKEISKIDEELAWLNRKKNRGRG